VNYPQGEYRRQRERCKCGHQRVGHPGCCGCREFVWARKVGKPKIVHQSDSIPPKVEDVQGWVRNQSKALWNNSVDVYVACMGISSTLDPRKWENI
jgi:hypothetical protein